MKCLVIGAEGQLGRALQAVAPVGVDVVAPAETACNLTNAEHVNRWLEEARPDVGSCSSRRRGIPSSSTASP